MNEDKGKESISYYYLMSILARCEHVFKPIQRSLALG